MPELIGYDNEGNPQFSFSDEDKLKGISVRPHNALLDPAPVEADQAALPIDVTGVGAVPNQTTGFTAADKLFGLNGQERFQTWPERMLRSGVSLGHDVMTGALPVTTLRREDLTDIPAPQGATADSPLIGRLLNLSPVAADPRDPLIERAQDMAGLAGGATLGINPAEMTVASGMTKMAKNGAKLTPVEGNPFVNSLMSDTQKPGMALSALEKPAPVFFSALENAVNNITANKMPADQWLGTLTNAKGVRPEEMEWTGLKDFLAEQKGPVTKDQVQQYLNANKVELKEVNKGSNFNDPMQARKAELEAIPENERTLSQVNELSDIHDGSWDGMATVGANSNLPKFSKYQLPGATNYQEKLLTLPEKTPDAFKERSDFITNLKSKYGDENWFQNATETEKQQYEKLQDKYFAAKNDDSYFNRPKPFQSSHWDEPNVLAHVRMNDRTIDGKKSLHLEEIQSDWHQIARDKGYAVSADKIKKLRPQFEKIDEKLLNSNDEQLLGHPEVDGMLKMAVDKKIITPDEAKIYKQVSDTAQTGAVPDAPFKKTWHELVLKRMLREAAEKGYDRLSWTPGEAQAARYDLSKHVKEIEYVKYPDGSYRLGIMQHNGEGRLDTPQFAYKPEELSNVVGKEIADKIVKGEGKKYRGHEGTTLEGLDLKVGGEGMKGFYDQIIPKALEKIGKEHGVKVKQTRLEPLKQIKNWGNGSHYSLEGDERLFKTKEEALKANIGQPIHYIDIPQSLKDQALRKGFPLFSSGVMLSPITNDPFFDKEYNHDAHTKWRDK